MRPPESFVSQPIRSLQTMLRVIAEHDPTHESVIPDGIYGPDTVRAVSAFQRKHGLPVTGITDHPTWDAIVSIYEPALIHQDEAQELAIILNPGQVIRQGEQDHHIHMVQAMLHVLEEVYHSFGYPSRTGILDDATANSLMSFQALNALPVTGELDKHTWKHLALQYPLAANLNRNMLPVY